MSYRSRNYAASGDQFRGHVREVGERKTSETVYDAASSRTRRFVRTGPTQRSVRRRPAAGTGGGSFTRTAEVHVGVVEWRLPE